VTLSTVVAERVRWLVGLLVARPALSLVVLLAATAGAGSWGAGIEIRSDMEDLFPEDTPAVVRARAARDMLRTASSVKILMGGAGRETNRAAAAMLAERLKAHPELIDSVEYRRGVEFFEQNALMYLPMEEVERLHDGVRDAIKRAVKEKLDLGLDDDEPPASPGDGTTAREAEVRERLPDIEALKREHGGEDLREFYESPDGEVISVKAYPTFKPADTARTEEMMKRVQADVDAVQAQYPTLEVTFEGDYAQLSAAVDQIRIDLVRSSTVALAVIAAILAITFRRVRAVILIVVPLVAGLAWTMAFARLTIGHLNLITAFIIAILTGLGIDFAVHGVSRVDELIRKGVALNEALEEGLAHLGRPMVAATATTMSTFLALTVFEFRGFAQFGFIAAAGVALCLCAVYLVVPPLMMVLGGPKPRPDSDDGAGRARDVRGPARLVIALAVVATIAGALGLPRVVFDGDMRKMRPPTTKQVSELREKYSKEAETRPASPALIITENLAQTEKVYRHMKDRVETEPFLQDVLSIFTFVPEAQPEKLKLVDKTRKRLDRKYRILEGEDKADADRLRPYLDPETFGINDLPEWVRLKFTTVDGSLGRYVLLYPKGPKSDARHVLKIRDAYGTVEVDGRTYHATASWMITGEAFDIVRREGPWAVGLAALVVLILLFVDMRRPERVFASYVPLLMGFLLFVGLLGWFEVELNLFNIIVLPSTLGIGVDTAIHLSHRIETDGAVRPALRSTGVAAGVAAVTTAVGFASLLVVASEGLRSIGIVAVVGILTVYTLTVLLISAFAILRGVPFDRSEPAA
jgi:predicted RND superfamily exporter protein